MGRTGRATTAAEELNVTHSAVSRQVKALELALGVKLFTGPKHRLELTVAGRELLTALTSAFDCITAAVGRLYEGGDELHVAVHPSISVKWLIPRLSRFAALHPDVRLNLPELEPHATSYRGAHAVLRIVPRQRLQDPLVTGLMPNAVGPVMAPALAERFASAPLSAPRIGTDTHPEGWAIWAALAGVELPTGGERRFAHVHFAMDAALAGLGVAVLPWPLVADEIAARRLVAPLGFQKAESDFALLASPGADSRPLRRFRDWLVAEGLKVPPAP